jgi:hypothetical protein
MLIDALADQLNAGYVSPAGAGPAWKAAVSAGVDMSLVELNLAKSPWQRLQDHDAALRCAAMLRRAGKQGCGKS